MLESRKDPNHYPILAASSNVCETFRDSLSSALIAQGPSDRPVGEGTGPVPQSSAFELRVLNESTLSERCRSHLNSAANFKHSVEKGSVGSYGSGDLFSVSCALKAPLGRRRRILETISSFAVLISFMGVAALVLNFVFDSLGAAEKVMHVCFNFTGRELNGNHGLHRMKRELKNICEMHRSLFLQSVAVLCLQSTLRHFPALQAILSMRRV